MRYAGISMLLLALSGLLSAADNNKPHIILVTIEGLRADVLHCMGHTLVRTPHIDQLAKDGVLFENVYLASSDAIHNQTTLWFGSVSHPAPLSAARALQNNGYDTHFIGQFSPTQNTLLPSFTNTFSTCLVGTNNEHLLQQLIAYQNNESAINDTVHVLQRSIEQCLSYPTKPQLLVVSLPVSFFNPLTTDHENRYNEHLGNLPIPLTFEHDLANSLLTKNTSDSLKSNSATAITQLRSRLLQYYQSVSRFDDCLGYIRQSLSKKGLADNSVIILTATAGTMLGEHGLIDVPSVFTPFTHVPLLIYDPRQPRDRRGWREQRLINMADIATTLFALADHSEHAPRDGHNLMPLLYGQPVAWRFALTSVHQAHSSTPIPNCVSIRNGDWTYLLFESSSHQSWTMAEALYHTRIDPKEQRNVADNLEFQLIKENLKADMKTLQSQADP